MIFILQFQFHERFNTISQEAVGNIADLLRMLYEDFRL